MWRRFIRDYFTFTKKERKAVIVILSVILIFILLPYFFPLFLKQKPVSYKKFQNEIAQLKMEQNDSVKNNYSENENNELYDDYSNENKKNESVKAEVFYFDPNTTSPEDWKRLGIKDKTIHTIQNYLSKGGRFYKPADISKIWGLPLRDAQHLIPYVRIKNVNKEYSFEKKEYPKFTSYTAKSIQTIDVNEADTSAFISLPGIGSKLAQRIIAFRNKLGGFYSVDQLAQTYLLPDSTFQKIKPRLILGNTHIKQININTASTDEMKTHPYIRYALANAIFQYRQQHGNFNSVEEIKKIMLVNDDIFNKVAPYLTIQ